MRDLREPGPAEIHICVASGEALRPPSVLCREDLLVDPGERERAGRFRRDADRHLYIAGRSIVRAIQGAYHGVPPDRIAFSLGAWGKPACADPRLDAIHFNLAHTENLVAAAFVRGYGVGIDVERVSPPDREMEIAGRHFAPLEIAALRDLPPEKRAERFYEIWVMKESYVKALGVGLSLGLGSFSLDFSGPAGSLTFTGRPPAGEAPSTLWLGGVEADDRLGVTVLGAAHPHVPLVFRALPDGTARRISHTTHAIGASRPEQIPSSPLEGAI